MNKYLYCIARLKGRNLEIMYSSFNKEERDDILTKIYNGYIDYGNVSALDITIGFNNIGPIDSIGGRK